jgi:hypothetical protein
MEISRINSKRSISREEKKVDLKKDFSQSFNQARERKSEQQLKKMVEDIKKKGNRLVITKCYADVRAYKRLIKE